MLALVLALLTVTGAPAVAATPAIYRDHAYAASAGAASADKPQSKLWFNDGAWWALMANAAGAVNIFTLQADHTWRDTGTLVDNRATSTGDALWVDGSLYVATRTAGSSGAVRVYRYSYSASTRAYTRVPGFAFTAPGGGTESATVDRDSTGALWVTFTRGSAVWVMHTTSTSLTTWTAPFRISGADTSVSSDDISAVIAFNGKIGVMWSDQASNAIRFAVHADGAPDTSWTVETPLAGTQLADDHLNIKSLQGDDNGRIYAAVKTSLTAPADPILLVLTRTAAGAWSAATTATVADKLTRPQLALDKTNKVMYVMQSTESGGTVYYKSSPLGDRPSFSSGKGSTLIAWPNARINNVSTTKDPVTSTTGLVAIASDEFAHRYYHAELALDGSSGGGGGGGGGSTEETVTLAPTADTYAASDAAGTNFGTSPLLGVDASPVTVSYLKFDLSAYAGRTLNSATLQVRVSTSGSSGRQNAKLVLDDTWTETGITYTSRPPLTSTVLGTLGPTSINTTYTVGLTAAGIAGQLGENLTIGLDSSSTNGVDLASRETGSTAPQLILKLATPAG